MKGRGLDRSQEGVSKRKTKKKKGAQKDSNKQLRVKFIFCTGKKGAPVGKKKQERVGQEEDN